MCASIESSSSEWDIFMMILNLGWRWTWKLAMIILRAAKHPWSLSSLKRRFYKNPLEKYCILWHTSGFLFLNCLKSGNLSVPKSCITHAFSVHFCSWLHVSDILRARWYFICCSIIGDADDFILVTIGACWWRVWRFWWRFLVPTFDSNIDNALRWID